MDQIDPISTVLHEGVQTHVFPGAVLFVRHKGQVRLHEAVGITSLLPNSSPVQTATIYDLASLTKPLATVSAILLLVQRGKLKLEQPLATVLKETTDVLVGQVSLQDLLAHQSGLPAFRPYYQAFSPVFPTDSSLQQRHQTILDMILQEPLSTQSSCPVSIYSDLGYMVLGFVVERVAGQLLADFCRAQIFGPLQADPLAFGISLMDGADVAPTEEDPWRGRLLQGEVHDENAAALGGIAGHAGLFGTAQAAGQVTKAWLDSYLGRPSIFQQEYVRRFVTAQPRTSWAMGWDTPSQPSSSGQFFSAASFGHLGFTGTSIWIDPIRELEVIFLSNRVHPTRENQAIKMFRPRLHDAIIQELFM